MELGHRNKLKNIDVESFAESKPEKVKDLKIANYTVDAQPTPDMAWPDILTIAMHRELASANLYKDLAAMAWDPQVRQLFETLAAEEQKQKGIKNTTPYWRTLRAGGVINPKYPGGGEGQKKLLEQEGHTIIQKGKNHVVVDYEKSLITL